jgi:hypothetical protein
MSASCETCGKHNCKGRKNKLDICLGWKPVGWKQKAAEGGFIIYLRNGVDALLLEEFLFKVKEGKCKIHTVGWLKDFGQPAKMTITFTEEPI